jgi:hypothetical protein
VQHRQHAAVVLGARGHAELEEDVRDVLLDRVRGDHQHLGDALVRAALGHQPQHLALARRQSLQRIVAALAAEHVRDDGGVEHRSARGDPADRVGEQGEVGHAVLEQVADALGAVADQVDRVALLRVLAEHEHADLGVLGADLERRPQPVVGVVGRHLDVDDRDVGRVGGDLPQQVRRVAGLGHDLEPGVLKQPHDTLAQQRLVLTDDDPDTHGGPSNSTSLGDASSDLGTNPRAADAATSPTSAASSVDTITITGA